MIASDQTAPKAPATIWVIRFGVAAITVGAGVISFEHVRRFALAHGENEVTAVLYPLVLDGAAAAGAAAVLAGGRAAGTRRGMAWLLLIVGVLGSLGFNVASATSVQGQVMAFWPPVLVLIGVEVLASLGRRRSHPITRAADDVDQADRARRAVQVHTRPALPVPTSAPTSTPTPIPTSAPVSNSDSGAVAPAPVPAKSSVRHSDGSGPKVDELEVQRARDLDRAHRAETGSWLSRDELKQSLGVGTAKAKVLLDLRKQEREREAA